MFLVMETHSKCMENENKHTLKLFAERRMLFVAVVMLLDLGLVFQLKWV